MVLEPALLNLLDLVRSIQQASIAGDFVECGVWQGGSAFLMAKQLQQLGERDRTVWLCDSFEGLPPPQQIDGPAALAWADQTDSPGYFENCRATFDDVQEHAKRLGLSSRVKFVQGWFNETLPAYREHIGPIALLRVDCDWYDSVRCCLDELYDQVVPGGVIILDDYYTWDGCTLATHEFLSKRRLPHRILSANGVAAYFFKQ